MRSSYGTCGGASWQEWADRCPELYAWAQQVEAYDLSLRAQLEMAQRPSPTQAEVLPQHQPAQAAPSRVAKRPSSEQDLELGPKRLCQGPAAFGYALDSDGFRMA